MLTDFCTILNSQNTLIDPHTSRFTHTQYMNYESLAESLEIGMHKLAKEANNVDLNDLNFNIRQTLPGDLVNTNRSTQCAIQNRWTPRHNCSQLKVEFSVILLRNLLPQRVSNGTRLILKNFIKNTVAASI